MRRSLLITCLLIIILIFSGCEKPTVEDKIPDTPPEESSYKDLETRIRSMFDFKAVFTWEQYSGFLTELSRDKYIVLPVNEMRSTYDPSKVIIGLRHDIDMNPFKAIEMSRLEKEYGIRATYFVLPTAEYYGTVTKAGIFRNAGLDSLLKELYHNGTEIGMHNDLLTVMIEYGLDPFIFNSNEMKYLKSLKIPIYGTASHGSPIAKKTVPNYQIFSDFAKSDSILYNGKKYPIGKNSLNDFGFDYEAYFIDFNIYFSDSGGKWNDPGGLTGIIDKLNKSVPGDRIQILVHPDWWGKVVN